MEAIKNRLPDWIKVRRPSNTHLYRELTKLLEGDRLHTVCQEANCPNIYSCFLRRSLTFMILGSICTRNCSYCNVTSGKPHPPDEDEPVRVARLIERLELEYVVITCVTRDDLDDGGAGIFSKTVKEIKRRAPKCKVELLISDLRGDWRALATIVDAKPEVIGHNVEITRELFPKVRPQASYSRSIELLKMVKAYNPKVVTKSGIMVGMGETTEEIIRTMEDVIGTGCNIMTIGQYLRPSSRHAPVRKFYEMEEFAVFKEIGESMGFDCVESGPLVRSSYKAWESYQKVVGKRC